MVALTMEAFAFINHRLLPAAPVWATNLFFMQTSTTAKHHSLAFLKTIIDKGGPDTREYAGLNAAFETLATAHQLGELQQEEMALLTKGFGDEHLDHTMHGHIKSKPFGYAGDFLIIDKMYREQVTHDDRFARWDIFWNNHAAAKAVRNRKDYFLQTLQGQLGQAKAAPVRLLNVASGPARDLYELYSQIAPESLQTTCVEVDKRAIEYAAQLNAPYSNHIQFVNKNIFRFHTPQQFDVVWSAGLFDYFTDAVFVRLLKRLMTYVQPGGEVVVGNFSTANPSRAYMELIGDWHLHHRNEEHLTRLALEAGAQPHQIRIGREAEGVNLFLHVQV